jgi:hypothetical protein
VRVGGPGIGQFDAVGQRRVAVAGTRPQTERTIDVQPGLVPLRDRANLAQRIDRTGVHVARLRADDRRALERGHEPGQAVGAHASLFVGLHTLNGPGAEAEVAQGHVDRDVGLGRRHDIHARRSVQAIGLHVPAGATAARRDGPRPGR